MKDFYICDCTRHENKVITSTFVVVAKQIKPKKTGEPYIALTLGDRSGQLEAKMWDNVEEVLDAFEQDDFLKIKGLINKYKNRFQLTIHKLRKLGDSEIEFDDYLPKTTKNIDDLWRTLAAFVVSFQNPYLRSLLQAFMADPEIAASYRNAPAAKTLHHAYIGGLLDQRTTAQFSKVPGIGDLPIIGQLFRSRTVNKTNSELIVIVTPTIVDPAAAQTAGPELPKMPIAPLEKKQFDNKVPSGKGSK